VSLIDRVGEGRAWDDTIAAIEEVAREALAERG
jgi:hypothetical protein